MENGANIHQKNSAWPILVNAVYEGHIEIVKYLVKKGVNLYEMDRTYHKTALLWACRINNKRGVDKMIKMIDFLVENGETINSTNGSTHHGLVGKIRRFTPLMEASFTRSFKLIKYLVDKGAEINVFSERKYEKSYTPLSPSLTLRSLKYLMKNGEDLAYLDKFKNKFTGSIDYGIKAASKKEANKLVNYLKLLTHNLNNKLQNKDYSFDEIKCLIKKGANINYFNEDGLNTFFIACLNGDLEVVKLLIENKAEINKVNVYGETALFYALSKNHFSVVKYLVEKGSQINVVSKEKLSLFDITKNEKIKNYLKNKISSEKISFLQALRLGDVEKVNNFLDTKKYDIDYQFNDFENYGKSPLMIAAEYGHLELLKNLLNKGANYYLKDYSKKNSFVLLSYTFYS